MAEKRVRKRRLWKRLIAFLMAAAMVLSLVVIKGSSKVEAAQVNDFAVTINFFEFDQTTPKTPALYNGGNGQNYHVVISLTDKETGNVAGYGFVSVPNINQATQTLHITRFWNLDEQDQGYRRIAAWHGLNDPHDDGVCSTYFDTDKYEVSAMRLYYGDKPDYESNWVPGASYSALIKQTDSIDGYLFKGSSFDQTSGEINLYEGHQAYEVALNFDPDMEPIAESDGYHLLVEAKHDAGNYSYYYAPLVTDGSNPYKIRIKNGTTTENGDWKDNNGNPTKEKYTGNWSPVKVYILKESEGLEQHPNLNSALARNNISDVTDVKGYSVDYATVLVADSVAEEKTVYNCENINLKRIVSPKDYNLFSVLGDSLYYGVTAPTITQTGHSETNMAVKVYTPGHNLEPDLSGDESGQVPGNFLIGEITDGGANFQIGAKTPATPIVMVGQDDMGQITDDSHNAVIVPMDKEDINSSVDNMIDYMKVVSNDMIQQPATITPSVIGGILMIDTTNIADGTTVYIDADAYLDQFKKDGGVKIKRNPNQMIVFNFKTTTGTETDPVKISKILCDFGDGTGYHDTNTETGKFGSTQNDNADMVARGVVWNLHSVKHMTQDTTGGIFLNPNTDSHMYIGKTSCGWVVSAGDITLGEGGEFHFVYRGLKPGATPLLLQAFKNVDGKAATAAQKFVFGLERYNSETGLFEVIQQDVMVYDPVQEQRVPTGDKEDVEETNTKNKVSFTAPIMEEGRNVYRIKERRIDDSTTGNYSLETEKEVYAVFNVTVKTIGGAEVKIPSGVTYYGKFENGQPSEKLDTAGRTFNNTTLTDDTAKLDLVKTFGGPVVEDDLETLSFEVKSTTGYSKTLTLKKDFEKQNDGSYKLKQKLEVPLGDYTVTEKNYNKVSGQAIDVTYKIGNQDAKSGTEAAIKLDQKDQEAVIAFNNEYPVGKLEVTKTVTGQTQINNYNVSVKNDATGKYYDTNGAEVTGDAIWVTVIAGEAKLFENLPLGTYTVTEDTTSVDVPGFTFLAATSKTSDTALEVTKNGTTKASLENKYSQDTATLVIEKKFGGPVEDSDLETLYFDIRVKGETTILHTYTLKDNFNKNTDGSYTLKEECKLPLGTYTVTEMNYNQASGVAVAVTYDVDGTKGTGDVAEVAMTTKDGTNTVEFTDTYPDKVGKLKITKTFGGPVVEADKQTLSFLVKKVGDTGSGKTYKLDAFTPIVDQATGKVSSYELEIELKNEELGQYTVTESNYNEASGASVEVSYTIDGGSKTVSDAATATVEDAKTTTVAFNNEYLVGSLEVSKTVTGQTQINTYKISVQNEKTNNFYNENGEVVTGDAKWITVTAGTPKTFNNLPVGKYSVTEDKDAAAVPGYTLLITSVTGKDNVEVKKNDTTKVALKNEYSQDTAKLEIEKTFGGPVVASDLETLKFEIADKTSGTVVKTLTLKDDFTKQTDGTYKMKEECLLPVGTYTVTEKNYNDVSKVAVAVTYEVDGVAGTGDAAEVAMTTKNGTNTVKFTNDYPQGNLKITKTFGGPVVEADFTNLTFDVYSNVEGTTKSYKLSQFTKVSDTEYTLTLPVVAGGYKITEKNYNEVSHEDVEVTYQVGTADAVKGTEAQATVTKGADTLVTFNNKYPDKAGQLIITKTFGGPVVEADKETLKFVVQKTGATTSKTYELKDFTEENGVYTKVIALTNDELGEYTITETNYNDVSKVDVAVSYKIGADGEVKDGKSVTTTVANGDNKNVIFTNDYPQGNLVITKTFGGPVVEADFTYLTFDVYSNIEGTTKSYKLSQFTKVSDTEYTLTLPVVAGGYKITEKNYNEASHEDVEVTYQVGTADAVKGTEAQATVTKGADTLVTFNNKYPDKAGQLIITKTFGGPVVEADKETLKFTVQKTGETTSKIYELKDFTEQDGVYTKVIALTNDELGEYTITETNYNDVSKVDVAVSYKIGADGEVKEGRSVTTTVANGDNKNVIFTNDYPQGNLKITKTFGGPVVEADFTNLTFDVYSNVEGTTKSYKLSQFTKVSDTEYTLTLPVVAGGYKITEKNYNDASHEDVEVTYQVGTADAVKGTEAQATVTKGADTLVTFNNEYPAGSLEVTKTVTGQTLINTFKVSVQNETTNDFYNELGEVVTGDAKWITVTAGTPKLFSNLPVGQYKVAEDTAAAQVPGFSLLATSVTAKNNVAVTKGGKAEVALKNDYSQDTAKLAIEKTFGGPVVASDLTNLKFEIRDKATGTLVKTLTLKDDFAVEQVAGEDVYKLKEECFLPLGTYTVTEKNYNEASGVAVAVTYDVDGTEGTGTAAEVAMTTKDGTSTVKFTDEYPEGNLIIKKTFGGPVVEADKDFLEFDVYSDVTKVTDTYKLEQFTKISNTEYILTLPVVEGGYTVTEKNYDLASGEEIVVTYKVGDVDAVEGTEAQATVLKGEDTLVTFNNEYPSEADTAKLEIEKTFGGPVVASDLTNLKFEIADKTTGTVVKTLTLKDDFTKQADGTYKMKEECLLPLGTYTVTEKNYNEESGVAVEVTYDVDGTEGTGTAAEVAMTTKDGTSTVKFTDEYPEGNLIIRKTFGGPVVEADKDFLKFEVHSDVTGVTDTYMLEQFTKISNTEYILTLPVVEGGYKVTEKNYDVASGAEIVVTYKVGDVDAVEGTEAQATVLKGANTIVTFNNEYPGEKETGKISVHVTEEKSGLDVPDATVEVTDENGNTVTYKTDENGEIVDENGNVPTVPAGEYTVTVTEVPDGYDVKTGETGTVTVPKDGEGHHDAVIATDRGGILITVLDEKTGEPVSEATVEVTQPDGTTKTYITDENGQVTDYAKKDDYGNYTAETGDYTYKVTKVPDGYHVTVGEEQTGTVETGKLTELEAKIATDTGKLTVHVTEEKSGLDVPDATVEVTDENGKTVIYTTNEKGEIVDENGEVPTVPAGEYTVTVTDVPEGYDVTTGEMGTVDVPKDGEGHHDAVIETDRGALIITVLDEETGEPVPNAEIELTTPDGKTHTYVTDENGQVTDYAEKDEYGNYTAETGDYSYTVTKVPEGYRVTVGEEREGEVKTGELTELESKIAHSTGGLDIVVRDAVTKNPVPGATVEVVYPDGSTHTFVTDENGMITELTKKDDQGHYLAKTGSYKITVVKVPEGYTVTTGETATEVVETDQVKHHVAEIATASSSDRKPPENTAQTGDETPITMLFILMMISAGGFAGAFYGKKRQSKKRVQK